MNKILYVPHPLLRQKAQKINKVTKEDISISNKMITIMKNAPGVGLAANQVGELQRIIVIQLPEEEARIYVNPEIIKAEGEREVEEGCLSIPGYRGKIIRSVTIRFGALDHSSKRLRIDADGLLAQALEHEIDHLNGILYTDHLRSHDDFYMIEEDHEGIEHTDTRLDDYDEDSGIIVPTTSDGIIKSYDSVDDATKKVN